MLGQKRNRGEYELEKEGENNELEVVMTAVAQDGLALQYASPDLRANEKVVLAAIEENPEALQYASELLRNNRHVVSRVLYTDNGNGLQYASHELRNSTPFMIRAVFTNGCALKWASPKLRNNKGLAMCAIYESPKALPFVHKDLRRDPEVYAPALFSDPGLAEHLDPTVKQNHSFLNIYNMAMRLNQRRGLPQNVFDIAQEKWTYCSARAEECKFEMVQLVRIQAFITRTLLILPPTERNRLKKLRKLADFVPAKCKS